jgi:hypothetical protein
VNKVSKLNARTRLPILVDSLQNGLIDGYNAIADAGRIKEHNAYTMVGYLSASIIALKCCGNLPVAKLFEQAANNISMNWMAFEREVKSLNDQINQLE